MPESLLADSDAQAVAFAERTLVTDTGLGALWSIPNPLLLPRLSHMSGSRFGVVSVAASVPHGKYTPFSKLLSHRVRHLVLENPSDRVHPAWCPHERLTAACVSEIRTHPVCWTIGVRERCTFLTISVEMVVWHSLQREF